MVRFAWAVLLAATGMTAAGVAWGADGREVRLDWVGEGVTTRLGWGYVQPSTQLSTTRPATLRVVPPGLKHPEYGELPVGSQSLNRVFHVVTDADEVGGMRKRIWIDANGDGDLTNDPPVTVWKEKRGETKGKEYRLYKGAGQVDIGPDGKPLLATLGLMTYYPTMPGASERERQELVYWRDYMRMGKVEIGGKAYQVWLDDGLATGDFTGQTPPPNEGLRRVRRIAFMVDRNGNGEPNGPSEGFYADEPFNVGGVTYEIRDMTPSGDSFRLVKSAKSVEELPLAADIAVGKVGPAFSGPGLGGGKVNVPGDFKGKVVLLDFWATWCGPCMRAVPDLRDVYARYHDKGFEIVAICENDAEDRQKVVDAVQKERMIWPQIYDGKADRTESEIRYGIGALPAFVLLDGDTGVVLATTFRKEGMANVIEREMRKKGLLPAGRGGK